LLDGLNQRKRKEKKREEKRRKEKEKGNTGERTGYHER